MNTNDEENSTQKLYTIELSSIMCVKFRRDAKKKRCEEIIKSFALCKFLVVSLSGSFGHSLRTTAHGPRNLKIQNKDP